MDLLKKILSEVLKSTPNYRERTREFEVYEAWPRIVGDRVAKHCWPAKMLDNGVLLVASQSSAWLQSLRYLEQEIIAKYEREFKEKRVKALRYKMASPEPSE
ncbi:MAG: DUF721 domain-containing protein [Bdellovibrionota bacterium]